MKKNLNRLKEIKQGYLSAKSIEMYPAYMLANVIFLAALFLFFFNLSLIMSFFSEIIAIIMLSLNVIINSAFFISDKLFSKTIPISGKLLDKLFGRYGNAIKKSDWKRIKKENQSAYKYILSKKSFGHCYATSWFIAIHLDNAKIMYCSIQPKNSEKIAHAVFLRNNCIYDTNFRKHYDYDEYLKHFNVEIYKIFDKSVYQKESFFDDIRDGFVNWCRERDIYCNPQ